MLPDEMNEFCEKCGDYKFFERCGDERTEEYTDAVVFKAEYVCSECETHRTFEDILYRS